MKKIDARKVQIIIGIIIIAAVNLWNLRSLYSITIVNDEFAYVGIAAQMTGYDWTNLLETSWYYSYGYSIVLSLLFRLGFTGAAFFRAAVMLNVVFLIMAFIIACYLADKIIHSKYDILIALAITLYSCNIFQSKLSWPENILCFLAWLLMYFIYQLTLKFQTQYLFAVIITSVYMYTVHQRCLSIIIAAVMMVGVILMNGHLNKKNICKTLAALLFLVLLWVLAGILKDYIITNWYLADSVSEGRIAVNDYSGQVNKIAEITTPRMFVSTLFGLAGKLWAQAAASGMLILIALVTVSRMVLRKGILRLQAEEIFSIAAVLIFAGALGIATLYKTNHLSNFIYYEIIMTRYIDYTAGPMLLLGFKTVLSYKKYFKEILVSIGVMAALTLSTYFAFGRSSRPLINSVNTASVYPIIGNLSDGLYRVLIIGGAAIIFVLAVMGAIHLGNSKNRANMLIPIVLIGLICVWSRNGLKESVGYTDNKHAEVENYVLPVIDYMESIQYDNTIFYIAGANEAIDGGYNFLKILQFMLPEQRIELVQASEIDKISSIDSILILHSSERVEEFNLKDIQDDFLMDTGRLRVYMTDFGRGK